MIRNVSKKVPLRHALPRRCARSRFSPCPPGEECVVEAAGVRVAVRLGVARGLAACGAWELVVDLPRGAIGRAGAMHPLPDQLRALVGALSAARGEPVAVRSLYESAWGLRWVAPEQHALAVQAAVCRVRRLLEPLGQAHRIVAFRGAYALRPGSRGLTVHAAERRAARGRGARPAPRRGRGVDAAPAGVAAALTAALRERGVVENRDLRRRLGGSRSAMHRLLQRLQRAGALVRVGRGRAAHYVALRPCGSLT